MSTCRGDLTENLGKLLNFISIIMEVAIEMVRKATELDAAHKYSEAILMYQLSLEHFQKLVDGTR